jgi:hypothetical protein
MLMGLLAKNAILIVEFALDRRKQGMSISWAAVLGAAARLRPILMTSLAMIVGLIPLMLAMGVGAHGNRTLGASAKRTSAKFQTLPKLRTLQKLKTSQVKSSSTKPSISTTYQKPHGTSTLVAINPRKNG